MDIPDRDFDPLAKSCDLLEHRLEQQFKDLESGKITTLDQEGGCQTDDLVRVIEASVSRLLMNRRAARRSSDTERKREPSVALIQARCRRLLALIERNAGRCRAAQADADAALTSIRTGGRFLQCMRVYDHRQPRFVDACH